MTDREAYDPQSRVNPFVHVNYGPDDPRYGILLCVNGTGILNSWLKHQVMGSGDYTDMNNLARQAPPGADGLMILPFGNGAERTLDNRDIGAHFHNIQFNTHKRAHYLRAAQEGVVFALNYGLEITRDMGVDISKVRAGRANMFLSPLFREVFAATTGTAVELYDTDGSQGAARGAGIGAGLFKDPADAFTGLESTDIVEPDPQTIDRYREIYNNWKNILMLHIKE